MFIPAFVRLLFMALRTAALHAEGFLPVVTGAARFPLLHLLHRGLLVLLDGQEGIGVARLAGDAGVVNVEAVAEEHLAPLVLDGNIPVAGCGKSAASEEQNDTRG
jgi:hypothetical protein